MIRYFFVAVFAFASAARTAAGPIASDSTPSPEDQKRFELLKQRFLQQQGIPPAAAGGVVVPGTTPPGKNPGAPPPSWEEQERERAAEFNKQFGDGAYEGITGFSKRCLSSDGCNKLATADIIDGAYKYVDLQKDVEKKSLSPESPDYQARHEEIKGGMRNALEEFRPRPGARAAYETDLIRVSDPIVKKIFTTDELLKYAERNAAAADSAPYYNYLGKALNGAGPPGRAKEAFDAALARDPKNEEALSGRAEARFKLADYAGAAGDARAALQMNPGDLRALTTLKFSEGRIPAGAAAALTNMGGGLGAGGGAAGDVPAQTISREAQMALSRAGGGSPAEMAQRSEGLVSEAKRSLSLGDARSAAALLNKATELNPRNAQALSLASMAYIRLKDYGQALAAAEAGLKLAPGSSALLNSKAFVLNHLKDYHGALDAADRALALNPRDAMAYFNRAAALGGLRDRNGMLAALKSAAELDPKFAPILDAALQMPQDSDILYLFPGEEPPPKSVANAPAAPGAWHPSWPMLGAGLLGVALMAGMLILRRREPPPAPPLLSAHRQTPELLAGKYEVGREIGSGGMGVVYEGQDRSLQRKVAIKRMREEFRWDTRERERFVAEAKLVAKMRHPNIVEIHAIVEQDGEVYLIFEHIAGRTLHELIQKEVRLPFPKARDLFRGVASALDYAHGLGVIHRDLKPANVMVDGEGKVRVMDFGIARLTEEALSRYSKTNTVVGTPLYMAPEQEQSVARKESDVYSMAVCLYEALTGQRPFAGTGGGMLMNKLQKAYEPASRRNSVLPRGLDEVFAKALDPDPDKRFASAGALARALEVLESPSTSQVL